LTLLPDDKAALALQAMSIERQIQVIDEFDADAAVALLSRMSPDLATDLLGSLGVETMKRYLGMMPQKQREDIIKLLQYTEDSVGGLMVNHVVHFGARTRVATAREQLKRHASDGDFISVIFVTKSNEDTTLVGTVTIRVLLRSDDETQLDEIMDPFVVTLDPFNPASEAVYKLIGSQIEALPVTDIDGHLVGAMTIDVAIGQAFPGGRLRALKIFS
jgi:Mg/Co/Ni transporter MgtE